MLTIGNAWLRVRVEQEQEVDDLTSAVCPAAGRAGRDRTLFVWYLVHTACLPKGSSRHSLPITFSSITLLHR